MGSFERYVDVIGGLLETAGIPGFLENVDDIRATADADGRAWKIFLELWSNEHGDSEVGVSDLYNTLGAAPDILAALDLGDGNANSLRARLGKQLSQQRDRIFDGRRLELVRSRQGANRWRLVSTTLPS